MESDKTPKTFNSFWTLARIQVMRYFGLLRRRWWVILLTVSLALCGAAWYISELPPAYLSTGRMMVSGQIRMNEGAVYTEELVNFFGTQVELMQSREVSKRAIVRVQSLHPDLAYEEVKLEVGQLPKASIFIMKAIGKSPLYTQAYLDACMEEYMSTKKEMKRNKTDNTTAAIADELVRLEKELVKREDEMHEFQKENNIGFLHEEGNSAGIYLAQLNRQMADLKTEYDLLALLDLDQNLDRQQAGVGGSERAGKQDSAVASYGPMGDYQKAKQQIQQLQADKEDLSRYLRPKHPTMVALNDQISKGEKLLEAFRQQSVDTLKTRRESIRLQMENLQTVIKQWEAKALDLSGRIANFDKIKSKTERTKNQYDHLLSSMQSVNTQTNVDQDTVSILEKATPAISIRPGLEKILIEGLALGLLLGFAILFVMDKLDDRIGSFIEFRSQFTKELLLGQIPREEGRGPLPLLQPNDERHALLESFRTLRSSIIFLPVEGARPKTLLVTSAVPGEGKTTIASDLAISFAFSGAKTLLVDADLRRGRLHEIFGVSGHDGFAKVLQQRMSWQDAVLPSGVQNLSILPRGKTLAHPSEHFLGKICDQFLKEIYAQFDYIIFDTAPVMAADDALSLAPKIDGTMFVLRFAASSGRMSRKAVDLLTQRQVNLLGIICNDVKLSESDYGYGYYYQYSGHDKEDKEAEAAV